MSDKGVTLIVGVGPGLGAALARCFAGAGMDVAVAARDGARLEPLAGDLDGLGVRGRAYACDVTREGDVRDLFARVSGDLGEPDVVVFNAGAFVRKGILETESAEFERCWRITCLGGFHVGRAAAEIMVRRGRGTVLFSASRAARGPTRWTSGPGWRSSDRGVHMPFPPTIGRRAKHAKGRKRGEGMPAADRRRMGVRRGDVPGQG